MYCTLEFKLSDGESSIDDPQSLKVLDYQYQVEYWYLLTGSSLRSNWRSTLFYFIFWRLTMTPWRFHNHHHHDGHPSDHISCCLCPFFKWKIPFES